MSSPVFLSPLFPSWLYWTNWGDMAYIGRAGMDGRNASAIITTKMDWPRALTIDYTTNKIFFADAHLSYLEWDKDSRFGIHMRCNAAIHANQPSTSTFVQLCRHGWSEPTPGNSRYPLPRLRHLPVWRLGLLDRLEHTHSGEGPQVHRPTAHVNGQQHPPAVRHSRHSPIQAASQYVHFTLLVGWSLIVLIVLWL